MSASREEKNQKELERREKRRQEERADRRAMTLYTVVGAVVVLAAVALMVWTSGIIQRNLTAVQVGDSKYTAVDLQYYYTSVYNSTVTNYVNQYYFTPFDTTASTKGQVYDQQTGQTWYDYLMQRAVEAITADTVLAARATQEGYVLSEDAQATRKSNLAQLDSSWVSSGYQDRNAYIHAAFGPYMTYDRLVELLDMQLLASDYAAQQLDAIQHPDADYDAYYAEHADELDTITFHQFLFQARVPTTDEEGNTIERTEQEQAEALEAEKAVQKALAEELLGRLEAGEDPAALAEEYDEQLFSSILDRQSTGSNAKLSLNYADWLLDSGRSSGDVTLSEYDTGSAYNYYVVVFEGRALDETPTADVRHILVAAEQDEGASEPTQEQYDAAYAQAEELLEQWKSGPATEASFTELAKEHSADPGVTENEGLYTNISSNSSYVDTFKEWALDASRQPGDTGIVQNTGSSTKGWHIMYFVASGDPIWKQSVSVQLQNQDYEQLVAGASEGVSVTQGMGARFVSD